MATQPELVARLEAAVAKLEKLAVGGAAVADDELSPQSIAYEQLSAEFIAPLIQAIEAAGYAAAAKAIGDNFATGGKLVDIASRTKSPTTAQLTTDVVAFMGGVATAEKKVLNPIRDTDWFKALKAINSAANWMFAPITSSHVDSEVGAATFSLNKLARNVTGDDLEKVRGVLRASKAMSEEFTKYVIKFHKGGLAWNPAGKPFSLAGGAAAAAPAAAAAAAPPAPKVAIKPRADAPAKPSGGGMGSVFAAIGGKGTGITGGLKKVDASMKTKNRPLSERSGAVPAQSAAKKAPVATGAKKAAVQRPPSLTHSKKQHWVERYIEGVVTLEDVVLEDGVCIDNCGKAMVDVKSKAGKFKQITINKCKGTTIQIDQVVSTVEIINSANVTLAITKGAPSIAIDGGDSITVLLEPAAQVDMPQFVTSKISACNISLVDAEGNVKDHPIPEQFTTKIDAKGHLTTAPVNHGD